MYKNKEHYHGVAQKEDGVRAQRDLDDKQLHLFLSDIHYFDV